MVSLRKLSELQLEHPKHHGYSGSLPYPQREQKQMMNHLATIRAKGAEVRLGAVGKKDDVVAAAEER